MLRSKGNLLIISSPSGGGKSSLTQALIEKDQNTILSISTTTRIPRAGEQDGKNYHFVDRKTFEKMIKNNEFLEYANVFGNYYGTPKHCVSKALSKGLDVVFDIDGQGAKSITSLYPTAITIFILPPSIKILEDRLRTRNDNETIIQERMTEVEEQISYCDKYDYIIVNDTFSDTLRKIHSILVAERQKRTNSNLTEFIQELFLI